jgi:2-oxoglutarate ferredoxin oxidoreductase subunit alpha
MDSKTTTVPVIAWKIGGDQGEGIDSTGDALATVANRMGYHVYGYKTFSSRIKGGHTNYKVRIGVDPLEATTETTDILVALNQETIDKNVAEVHSGGFVLADQSFSPKLPDGCPAHLVELPLTDIAKEVGSVLMRNMVAVGASAALLNLPLEPFDSYVERRFGSKGAAVVSSNQAAVRRGYDEIQARVGHLLDIRLGTPHPGDRLLMSGNDALALGAIAGGCRVMAAYPITPASDVMEDLIKWFPLVGGVVVQAEDEMAAVLIAIGAGFAGARGMTATSGPGFSLMQEAIGLASMTETPVVIADIQRSGPSTGMPTKQEQSDFLQMVNGSHGEAPRIVLTPSSIEEIFADGMDAFNLADRYQCPVLVASDLSLGLWKRTVERSAIDYQRAPIDRGLMVSEAELRELGRDVFKRYQLTETGVSPRSVPGMPFGQFLATGNEHGENGKVTEDPGNRERMMHKRLHKLDHFERESVRSEGPADADIMLVAIGSTVGILREAKAALAAQGHRVGLTWLRYISPFPVEETRAALSQAQRVLVVEQNATGQLLSMMKVHGIGHEPRFSSFLKVNGVPFTPEEVVREVNGLLPVREVV